MQVVHNQRLPLGASVPLCCAWRLQTTRPQLPQTSRHAEQTAWSPSVQVPSCVEQWSIRHDTQTRECSAQAGFSSILQVAMPWSAQKSSLHTEQRVEQALQAQCPASCRHTTSSNGAR